MSAAPYFLALSENDTLLERLCEKKLFQVAFVIAKMRNLEVRQDESDQEEVIPGKPQSSPKKPSSSSKKKSVLHKKKSEENTMVPVIVEKWASYLISTGQYEAAATM